MTAVNIAHSVTIRVFCGQEENRDEIMGGLKSLIPFDTEKEKVTISKQKAFGFNERKIDIFEAILTKNRHVNTFIDSLLPKISGTDKQMLLRQLRSRIDDEANFFIRFDKESLAKRNDLLVTDSGNCYHVKIKIACFPATKEKAITLVSEFINSVNPESALA